MSEPKTEYVWLIESFVSGVAYNSYFVMDAVWCSDPYRARRFATKEDAEAKIKDLESTREPFHTHRAVEHAFDPTPEQIWAHKLTASRAREKVLHEALRLHLVQRDPAAYRKRKERYRWDCRVCGGDWLDGEPENHLPRPGRPICIARPDYLTAQEPRP